MKKSCPPLHQRCDVLLILLIGFSGLPIESSVDAAEPSDVLKSYSWSRPGEDWPTLLGPTANGRSSLKDLRRPWPKTGPKQCWQLELGEGYCSPAVATGVVVVFDRVGKENRLRCLTAETGHLIWERRSPTAYTDMFGYDGGPRAAPVIADGRVITYGADGILTCWSIYDGTIQWQIDTARRYHVVQNFFGVAATPIIFKPPNTKNNALVIIQVGGSPPAVIPEDPQRLDLVKGLDSGLVAVDLVSGKEVWRSSEELASYSTPVLTKLNNQPRLLAWMRSRLLLVDPVSGTIRDNFRWRADELFSVVAASPVVRDSQVLLSETYGPGSILLDITNDRFEEVRRDPPHSRPRTALRAHWATPVLHEGAVYGSTGRNAGDAMLACGDWTTGTLHWTYAGLGRSSCTLVDDHLVVLGEFGDLLLVKATTAGCEIISECRLLDPTKNSDLLVAPCWAAPVIAHGYLYVRGAGRLICLDLL